MKSFTAKEFSRCPARVYEAAREDGEVEVTHDRFNGKFYFCFVSDKEILDIVENVESDLAAYIERGTPEAQGVGQFMKKKAPDLRRLLFNQESISSYPTHDLQTKD